MASVGLSRHLWDPYRVLDVYPNGPKFTCVGVAVRTGARCRWPFDSEHSNTAQRDTAGKLLESMSEVHPSEITPAALYLLAENTLCREWHQRQAGAKVTEWKARIGDYLREHGERLAVVSAVRQLQNCVAKEKDASKQEFTGTRQALEGVTDELKASQTRCSELTEKIDTHNRHCEENRAATSRDIALLKQQQPTESRTSVNALNQQNIKEVENLKKQLEAWHAKFETDRAASSEAIRGLKDSKARLDRMTTDNTLEIVSLKAKVRDRDKTLDESARMSEEIRGLKDSKARLDRMTTDNTLEIVSLKAKVRDRDKTLDERARMSEEKAEDLRQRLAAGSREVAILTEAKASSEAKAELGEKEAESLRQEVKVHNTRREALEAKSSQLGEQLDSLDQKYSESKKDGTAQMSLLQEQERKIEQLAKHMNMMKRDLAERDRHIGQLVKQMDVVKQESAERDRNVEQLVKQMDMVNQELAEREVGGSVKGETGGSN